MRRLRMKHALAVGLLLAIGTVHAQAPLKSPEAVSTGLRIMSQVVRHTDRLIAAKTYEQIPHECGEFEEGMKEVQNGVGTQPSELKTKLSPLLAKARVASNAMSEAAMSRNDAQLALAHDQFAAAVSSVIQLFPADLRPKPPAPPPAS